MKNFKSKINTESERIVIEISYKKRQFSSDPKFVFEEDIWDYIPDEYKGKVKLISSPRKPVSNIGREKYTQLGIWEFKIMNESKQKTQDTNKKRRTTTRRKLNTQQKAES